MNNFFWEKMKNNKKIVFLWDFIEGQSIFDECFYWWISDDFPDLDPLPEGQANTRIANPTDGIRRWKFEKRN